LRVDERAFEAEIAGWLTGHGGHAAGTPGNFDPEVGLDTAELWEFIGATQADDWHRLRMLHGGSADDAQRAFKDRLARELDSRGTVDVLRRGVVDHGVTIRLAYFRPAHGLTPALVDLYNANRLTVTRQLRYEASSGKAVDLALFVNGLPVATAEVKNPMTGQGIEKAKAQYRTDRDPANVTLARRAVVHFAVDPELVAMTTRLAGASTEFLPFNRGRDHGAGNPANPAGHRTAYLWQDVWARDNWLDLLQRFVHMESSAGARPSGRSARTSSRKVIFPRYHQWDAVRRLEAAARAEGPGHDYLVEHSAGSGKSNTIAWLAHRLSALHDASDNAQAWTEANMNGFAESRTAERFGENDSQILVVADKYQTGFDQPLLYAMYVDKTLGGVAAVQTLSRLNRTCDGKDGTFVLDFRNDGDQIRQAFARYYMQTVAPPTDPNLMYDTRAALDPYGVLWPEEIEQTLELLTAPDTAGLHGRIHAALVPSIDRFRDMQADQQDAFRDALSRFIHTYGFLSQVVAFTDIKLEGDYLFCRALAAFIRPAGDGGLDLGSAVELTHLRTEKTFAGSLALTPDTDGEVSTLFTGAGRLREADEEPLSKIVTSLNARFGTDFGEGDFVGFFGAVSDKLVAQADIQQAAVNNTPENFRLVLEKEFGQQVMSQMGAAEAMALSYLDNESVRREVLDFFLPIIMGQAQVRRQEYCPIGELLGPDKENAHLEYKASLRTHAGTDEVYKPLETVVLKRSPRSPTAGTAARC